MVLSLIVVGAAIGIFVALLPKSPHAKVTTVPYLPVARALAQGTTLPIFVPDPLPKGWQSNYSRVGTGDSLHVGFVLDSDRFARLDEAATVAASYYRDNYVPTGAANPTPADAAARPPAGFEVHRSGGHVALLRRLPGGGILTLSDGGTASGASLSELVSLAGSLKQLPK